MDIIKKIQKLPNLSGIYLFYNSKKELIYVGKATSLRNRVRSYFSGRRTSRPIEQMIHEVVNIKTKKTDSVLEAIILEGNYIKKYRPKYNIDWKDDKSWNYVVITDEEFPRVKTIRSHEIDGQRKQNKQIKYLFGPYPGLKTREMMKTLRRLFFISTCRPVSQITQNKQGKQTRSCLYRQMGQCLGVCTGDISSKDYKQKVIRPLAMFLRGNKKGVIKNLEKKMKEGSRAENFEEAARLRNQVAALQRIQDIALLNKSFFTAGARRDRSRPVPTGVVIKRIEGYDISNLGSSGKVGSMAVFDLSGPIKSQYRKFKIRGVEGQSDVDCLVEILQRRFKHDEWKLPNIILVDGGLPQVNRAKKILKQFKFDIPVVGIAKGPARKNNEFILGSRKRDFVKWINSHQDLLIQVRDEAHRFAINYQRKLRKIKH